MATIIVCGGRDYTERRVVYCVLDNLRERKNVTLVKHGDAPGADTIAKRWCMDREVMHLPYPADWKTHGKAAGPIRNNLMAQEYPLAQACVAFPGGRGTASMIREAKKAGISIVKIEPTWTTEKIEDLFRELDGRAK